MRQILLQASYRKGSVDSRFGRSEDFPVLERIWPTVTGLPYCLELYLYLQKSSVFQLALNSQQKAISILLCESLYVILTLNPLNKIQKRSSEAEATNTKITKTFDILKSSHYHQADAENDEHMTSKQPPHNTSLYHHYNLFTSITLRNKTRISDFRKILSTLMYKKVYSQNWVTNLIVFQKCQHKMSKILESIQESLIPQGTQENSFIPLSFS